MRTIREMTMFTLIPEIFEKIGAVTTKEEVVNLLRIHNTPAMRKILNYVFYPNLKFCVSGIPEYRPDKAPKGHNPTSLWDKINLFYLFDPANPTPQAKKELILRQICESIHPSEADFIDKILKRDIDIPLLTYDVVRQAIPGLLPELDANGEMDCQFKQTINYDGNVVTICGRHPPCPVCMKKMITQKL